MVRRDTRSKGSGSETGRNSCTEASVRQQLGGDSVAGHDPADLGPELVAPFGGLRRSVKEQLSHQHGGDGGSQYHVVGR